MADKKIKIIYEVETVDIEKANQVLGRTAAIADKTDKEFIDLSKDAKRAGDATGKAFNSASKEVDNLGKSLNQQKGALGEVKTAAGKVGGVLAAAFTVTAIIGVAKRVFEITAQFQKYEAVLTNTLGSQDAANAAMLQIQETAAKTNFSVDELTDAYVKFANRGIKLTQAEMMKLADVANSTGKSFDQLTEAALDSFTGENERLKEFGIIAKKTGETTQFTFKGITTEVRNTQEEIKKYIIGLGDVQGVSGATEAISKTLEGRVSNLGDAFDGLFLNIGKATTGPLPALIQGFTDFVSIIGLSLKSVDDIKKEVSLLSLSKAMQGDIEEVKALANAYQKNGRTIEEATKVATENVIASFEKLKTSRKGVTAEEKKDLDQRIANLQKTFIEQKKLIEGEEGLLPKLRKELKLVQAERDQATNEKTISDANQRMEVISREIKRLEELGKAAKDVREKFKDLIPLQNLETQAAELRKIQELLFGDVEAKMLKQKDDFVEMVGEQIKARASQVAEENRLRDEAAEKEKKYRAEQRQGAEDAVYAAIDLASSLTAYQNQQDENRINALQSAKQREIAIAGDNTKAKQKIELEYDNKIKELRRKQAEREKRIAIFNAIVGIAQGVINAIKVGPPIGFVLAALVAAAGAVQIATITNQPAPQFNKGTKSVPGPHTNRDTVDAKLTPGEMVISLPTKKKYGPVLDAIFDNRVDPELLNGIAHGRALGNTFINNNGEVVKALQDLPLNEFKFDSEDIVRVVKRKGSKTTYYNERYSS